MYQNTSVESASGGLKTRYYFLIKKELLTGDVGAAPPSPALVIKLKVLNGPCCPPS
jgi:hypothetical protein